MPNQHKGYASLTDKDKDYIRVVHANSELGWDERLSLLTNKFGVNERNIRRWIKKLGFSSYQEIESVQLRAAKLKQYNSKYIILTWAQNATPVYKPFWENILTYAEYLGADVGVIPGRYQNPTSLFSKAEKDAQWWGDEVVEYLDNARQNVHQYLDILSDIKIRPTATNPLSGLEGVSGSRSSIIGHPSINLKSLPVLRGHPNKLMMTTGACTLSNYTDSKSGVVGDFHHCYGFVIVELKDDLTFYIRQVTAENDGSFIDLWNSVSKKQVREIDTCAAFVLGDIHVSEVHHPVMEETCRLFEEGITPRRIVLHDLFNGESINHHEADDPFLARQKWETGRNIVQTEVQEVFNFIEKYQLLKYHPIVVKSNHCDFLLKWLKESDWKKDIANSVEYMQYSLALLKGKAEKGVMAYLLEERYGDKITCLDIDDSFKIHGWELAQHGHVGTHGTRASLEQYSRLNTKIITGHSHIPARKQGAASVGTYSKLQMNYNHGPSSWMHSGILLHENGKIQHLIFADNKFTTLF